MKPLILLDSGILSMVECHREVRQECLAGKPEACATGLHHYTSGASQEA
jgi:hypothetical protein